MVDHKVQIPWPDWHIVRELGEGGYGKVYEIERKLSGLTDRAALKVIRIPKNRGEYEEVAFSLRNEEGARTYFVEQKEKLVNEIGIMKKLKTAGNIVSIEDWDVKELDDGFSWEIYIRMELLTPLKKKIRKQGDLNEQEIIKLGKDICNALILCEKNNIVHRDIKPDNILLAEHGSYKLGDFGIARNLNNETTMTSTFSTPYVSPEVYNRKKAGKTIDTYSLGLVMYEQLNNRRAPFLNAEGNYTGWEKEQAIRRRLNGEKLPEPLHGSPELKRIVLKACSYDPSDRYRTAAEFRNALEGIDNTQPSFPPIDPPTNDDDEIKALKKRLNQLLGEEIVSSEAGPLKDLEKDLFGEVSQYPEYETSKRIEKFNTLYRKNEEFQKLLDEEYNRINEEKQYEPLSLEDLEKELFGETSQDSEYETSKRIEKFNTLYRKNEEFQRLLDEEYNRLKIAEVSANDNDEIPERKHNFERREDPQSSAEPLLKPETIVDSMNTDNSGGKGCGVLIAILIIVVAAFIFKGEIATVVSHIKGEPEWVREYTGFLNELNSSDEEALPYDPSYYFLYDINNDAIPEMFVSVTEEEEEEKCLLLTYADKSNEGVKLAGTLIGSVEKIDMNNSLIATRDVFGKSYYKKYNIENLMKIGLPNWETITLEEKFLDSLPSNCESGELISDEEFHEIDGIEIYDIVEYSHSELDGINDYYNNHK